MRNLQTGARAYRIQKDGLDAFLVRRATCAMYRKLTNSGMSLVDPEMVMRAVSIHEVRHKVQCVWGNSKRLYTKYDMLNLLPMLSTHDVLPDNYARENDAQCVTWMSLVEMTRLNRYLTEQETTRLLISTPDSHN